jgi:hypothetical protein
MKKIVSAVLGLSLSLAVAFAQTSAPATNAPATKDNGSAMTTAPAKKHSKKHNNKKATTTQSNSTTAAPASSSK